MRAADLSIVPISVDDAETSKTLQTELGLTFELYADVDGVASQAWSVWDAETEISLAATFVVAPGGIVIYRFLGGDKTDRPDLDEVLAAVREARAR